MPGIIDFVPARTRPETTPTASTRGHGTPARQATTTPSMASAGVYGL